MKEPKITALQHGFLPSNLEAATTITEREKDLIGAMKAKGLATMRVARAVGFLQILLRPTRPNPFDSVQSILQEEGSPIWGSWSHIETAINDLARFRHIATCIENGFIYEKATPLRSGAKLPATRAARRPILQRRVAPPGVKALRSGRTHSAISRWSETGAGEVVYVSTFDFHLTWPAAIQVQAALVPADILYRPVISGQG